MGTIGNVIVYGLLISQAVLVAYVVVLVLAWVAQTAWDCTFGLALEHRARRRRNAALLLHARPKRDLRHLPH